MKRVVMLLLCFLLSSCFLFKTIALDFNNSEHATEFLDDFSSESSDINTFPVMLSSRDLEVGSYEHPDVYSGLEPVDADPLYKDLVWRKIHVPAMWNFRTDSTQPVSIADTGSFMMHQDFINNGLGGVSLDGLADYYYDEANDDPTGSGLYGHGTGVTGVVAATGNNIVGSTTGVCWNGKIYTIKITNLTTFNIVKIPAIITKVNEYNATHLTNQIKIINLSLGGLMDIDDLADIEDDICDAISGFNGLVICAAGNEDINIDSLSMQKYVPGGFTCSNIITVGASTGDEISSFAGNAKSNYGSVSVDLFAPGVNIYSTTKTDSYHHFAGTSFSTPMVSAAAAMIWEVNPNLSPAEVKNCILSTVDQLPAFNNKCTSNGRINMFKAVEKAISLKNNAVLNPKKYVGDFNGDSYEDMVLVSRHNNKLMLSTFMSNGDGYFYRSVNTVTSKTFAYSDPLYIADVNGDGKDDVVLHWVSSGYRHLMTFKSNGDGTFTTGTDFNTNYTYDLTNHPSVSDMGDVNGDGKADFIMHFKATGGTRSTVVFKGTASGTFTGAYLSSSTRTFVTSDPVYFKDVNGDGRTDIVVHWVSSNKRQLLVYTGNTNCYYFEGVNLATTNTHNTSTYPCQMAMADITGDGKTDFTVCWKDANGKRNFLVYRGSKNADHKATFLTGVNTATTNAYVASDPILYGDVNGDGYDDIVVHWVANSQRQFNVYKSQGANGKVYAAQQTATTSAYDASIYDSTIMMIGATDQNRKDILIPWTYKPNGNNSHMLNLNCYTTTQGSVTFSQSPKYCVMLDFPYYAYR